MDELKATYERQIAEYKELAAETPVSVEKVKSKGNEVASTLDQMLALLNRTKLQAGGKLDMYREELSRKLMEIQLHMNGLNRGDTLETLRRIREIQDEQQHKSLFGWMFAFLGIALVVALVLLFAQKADTSAMTPSMPSTTTDFA